jgi:hypothetical protein
LEIVYIYPSREKLNFYVVKSLLIYAKYNYFSFSFLPLSATAQGELWPPEQSASILLYSEADYLVSEQFSFSGVRLLASRPTPNLEGRVSLFV